MTFNSHKMIVEDISFDIENMPISVINDIDGTLPQQFKYIKTSIPSCVEAINELDEEYCGCNCNSSGAACSKTECECIATKNIGLNNYNENNRLVFCNLRNVLVDKPVFECNIHCLCSEKCLNRVVQKGIQRRLCVFKSKWKAWCLKTLEPIPAGGYVCEYAGEILNYSQAKERILRQTESDNNYIHVLYEHLASGKVIKTYVDPTHLGNVGRFINHSCNPNLLMIPVRIVNAVPKLSLFALRDIVASEELSFDYSGKHAETSAELRTSETIDRKHCHCQAPNCKSYLPFDQSLFK